MIEGDCVGAKDTEGLADEVGRNDGAAVGPEVGPFVGARVGSSGIVGTPVEFVVENVGNVVGFDVTRDGTGVPTAGAGARVGGSFVCPNIDVAVESHIKKTKIILFGCPLFPDLEMATAECWSCEKRPPVVRTSTNPKW